ncbi:VanZ family protein [Paenibacillus athensensis]|uniref:Teicoplanin resistance protein VanZ n=1 Tax=Paenibacillus athensensis TaxID=1967502 RepID=A0A4Y8QAC7_9BACL|nr:VanZ family protein [Paenibacillus athensensis]MCD1257638.1 VanZ family protein [Paenibacillus athensensis]
MKIRARIETVLLYGIFICYLIFLMKLLFLSRISYAELFHSERTWTRSVNLIPLSSILEYVRGDSETLQQFAFSNVAGNMMIFFPLGMYIPLFRRDKRMRANLLILLLTSVAVEFIQGLLALGTADIDDILLNTLGGWLGLLGYMLLKRLCRSEKRVRTVITLLSVAGLPCILYILFMVRLRL